MRHVKQDPSRYRLPWRWCDKRICTKGTCYRGRAGE